MLRDPDPLPLIVSIIIFIVLAVVMVVQCNDEKDEQRLWEVFRVEHNCKVVGYVKGATDTGLTSGGNVAFVSRPDMKTWLCDDGKTYTR